MPRSKFLQAPGVDELGLAVTTLVDVLNAVATVGADSVTVKDFAR